MSENWKIQVSPKLPDGTLINIRAESSAELAQLLEYVSTNAQSIVSAGSLLKAAHTATNPGGGQQQSQGGGFGGNTGGNVENPTAGQGFAGAGAATGGGERPADGYCAHGAYEWKDFVSQKGNAVKGWFCPSKERTDCKPLFRK